MKKIFLCFLFFFLIFTHNNIYSQIKPKYLDASIQLDATSLIYNGLLSGSIDLDVSNFGNKNIRYCTGVRFGYDYYEWFDVGGGIHGPFRDLTFLGKFSASSNLIECNYYIGLSHKLSDDIGTIDSKNINNIKTFLEIKLKVYKNFAGFIFKPGYIGNGKSGDFVGGLGLFIGLSTKDINF
jgi:hypothetical protein